MGIEVEVEEIEEIEPWTETIHGRHPGLGAIGENRYVEWGLSSLEIVLQLVVTQSWMKQIIQICLFQIELLRLPQQV